MNSSLALLLVQSVVHSFVTLAHACWQAALANPWVFLIVIGVIVLGAFGSRTRRPYRRRY